MDNSTPSRAEKLVMYLDGELTGIDKADLEQELATDKNLLDELESLQTTRAAIKLYGLKQKVALAHQQVMAERQAPVKKINPLRRTIRYSVAVAASLLLLIGGYWAYNFFTLSPDKVFASNYKSYELVTVRDGGNNVVPVIEKAYQDKKYTEVIGIAFDRAFTIKELFLRAMSYSELNDDVKAIEEYKKVLLQTELAEASIFKQQAEYYLALSYIRNEDYGLAIDLLNKIQDSPNHLYHEKVSGKLIRQVKMLKWR